MIISPPYLKEIFINIIMYEVGDSIQNCFLSPCFNFHKKKSYFSFWNDIKNMQKYENNNTKFDFMVYW